MLESTTGVKSCDVSGAVPPVSDMVFSVRSGARRVVSFPIGSESAVGAAANTVRSESVAKAVDLLLKNANPLLHLVILNPA